MKTTRCDECELPVAYDDLQPDGYGAHGPCPRCDAVIIRPQRRSRPTTPSDRETNGMSAA